MDKRYLTINECAELVGRSPSAIRNLCMRRKIPYRKAGGRLMFLSEEIQQWIERAEGLTIEELRKNRTI